MTQEGAGAIGYTGSWAAQALPNASAGRVRYATRAARATFRFTGTDVAWIASRARGRGKAEVWLDGVRAATLDLYATSHTARTAVFARGGLAPGAHTLEVRVLGTRNARATGTRVDLDGFVTGITAAGQAPGMAP